MKERLFNKAGEPMPGFNERILGWLDGKLAIVEHNPPAAFQGLRTAYSAELALLEEQGAVKWDAHRALLTNLTKMMFGIDITDELRARLSSELINPTGFRRTIGQSAAKNAGENFINVIVWAVADALKHQDEVLVEKGLPTFLRQALTMRRKFRGPQCERDLSLTIEGDLVIFSRSDPFNAVIVNAKTRLKEIFHVGTMWKLFFDMLDDTHCLKKWGLERVVDTSLDGLEYVFATADMVPEGGVKTQGGDVERDQPRNLIAVDASFFDYVFVSKQGIGHVANTLSFSGPRESLFHELGCLLDLVAQKFSLNPPA